MRYRIPRIAVLAALLLTVTPISAEEDWRNQWRIVLPNVSIPADAIEAHRIVWTWSVEAIIASGTCSELSNAISRQSLVEMRAQRIEGMTAVISIQESTNAICNAFRDRNAAMSILNMSILEAIAQDEELSKRIEVEMPVAEQQRRISHGLRWNDQAEKSLNESKALLSELKSLM